ncbi:fungal-specific transcription factor domain-containing protein [Xylariales sp. PMI_506]|nr:fungal-specific transcription factor domain-containing protein [Xylariales sp. PMI_506]
MDPPTGPPAAAPPRKLRSCVVCRSRKVKCDKQSPCSNCRRAQIACVFPSGDRPPRWARRLERITGGGAAVAAASESDATAPGDANRGVSQVMDRLRNLENLVKELSGQLEQANAAAAAASARGSHDGSSDFNSPGSTAHDRDIDSQQGSSPHSTAAGLPSKFGRLVVHDANKGRYVSSGFWSRVDDELNGLKMDTDGLPAGDSDTSDDEESSGRTPVTQELDRPPPERNAFLFKHNLSPVSGDLRQFQPLPSQIPFLLDVFCESVNTFAQVIHGPTIYKMVRGLRTHDLSTLSPSNTALLFSIFYAAITAMEEDDILTNFGTTKAELNLKYRLGLEYSLARADFLNVPDIVSLQAFCIFIFLLRRHDSPRFVWMMTGLAIRVGQALGLQRDGSHFKNLNPFEIEMRRRLWWILAVMDVRASEDQGMDLTITQDSFDTKLPLNVNDSDLSPDMTEPPVERTGFTDMSLAITSFGSCEIVRKMMKALGTGLSTMEDQSRLLDELFAVYKERYLQYSIQTGEVLHYVCFAIARLVMAKMALIVYLPVLFSSPSEQFSDSIRAKLLVSGIEVAEYNHTLNAEASYRPWRWVYQTYTHWHAIVFLLIEIARRPWSPIVERAWVILHSKWLIPAPQPGAGSKLRIWVPLRRLMLRADKHRTAELQRLRQDPHAAAQLEIDDRKMPVPSSSGPSITGDSVAYYREQWRALVTSQSGSDRRADAVASSSPSISPVPQHLDASFTPPASSFGTHRSDGTSSSAQHSGMGTPAGSGFVGQTQGRILDQTTNLSASMALDPGLTAAFTQIPGMGFSDGANTFSTPLYSGGSLTDANMVTGSWLGDNSTGDVLRDLDINMDLDDGDVNWYNWVESASKGLDWNGSSDGQ